MCLEVSQQWPKSPTPILSLDDALGRMPESGQGTLTDQMNTLLQDIFKRVDCQGLRLAYVTDEGYHLGLHTTFVQKLSLTYYTHNPLSTTASLAGEKS